MFFSCSLLLAMLVTAAIGKQVAVYWGQNDSERDLAAYCQSGEGIDILILAFLGNFGNGIYPNGNFGNCYVNSDQSYSGCEQLASDIATCQEAGVKVFLSLGGSAADNTWYLNGPNDATGVAWSLWHSYGPPSNYTRPFGNNVKIDGWDFDLESQGGNGFPDSYKYLGDLVNALRGYFASDSSRSYYISGAPQCVAPDANMGLAIQQAQFDYLFIQFYNNPCSVGDLFANSQNNPDGAGGSFNLDVWPGTISGGASAAAALHVGLAAAADAATAYDYVQPSDLPALLANASSVPGFNGFMLWDAGTSDELNNNGCTYAQELSSVLNTGNTC